MTIMILIALGASIASVLAAFVGFRDDKEGNSSVVSKNSQITIQVDGRTISFDMTSERVTTFLALLESAKVADEFHSRETISYRAKLQPLRKPLNVTGGSSDPSLRGTYKMAG